MADFTKRTVADMAEDRADINMGTTGALHEINWGTDDLHWREQYRQQPYATSDRPYEFYQPAYRYGCEASFTYGTLPWTDAVESELARGWPQARGESTASWDQVKGAVKDGWERARSRRG